MEEIIKFIEENKIEITIKSGEKELISMGCLWDLSSTSIRNSMSELSTLENNKMILDYITEVLTKNHIN